jgi:site-specific DNA-methyltransferase (adenine-specific)
MKNGFVRGNSLYPAHYALLYFTKGEPATFKRPKIAPARCRHCDGYIKDYGGYAQYIADGINLSDFWDDLSPVRHSKYKTRDANELPLEMLRRVVAISGNPGDFLLDPFAGSGTAAVAAQQAGMHFLAGDYDESNCEIIVQRLTNPAEPMATDIQQAAIG